MAISLPLETPLLMHPKSQNEMLYNVVKELLDHSRRAGHEVVRREDSVEAQLQAAIVQAARGEYIRRMKISLLR